MKSGKRVLGVIIVSLLLIVSIGLVSAGIKDWFGFGDNKDLGGELPETAVAKLRIQDTSAPIIVYVSNVTGQLGSAEPNLVKLRSNSSATNYGNTTMVFWFLAQQGGNQPGDLLNAGGNSKVNFSRTGELSRTNLSCSSLGEVACPAGFCTGTAMNLTCNVTMRFYDGNGSWNINVSVRGPGTNYASNSTKNFSIDATFAAEALTTYLNWSTPPLTTTTVNKISDNNISVLNNGNVVYNLVQVNATELNGTISPQYFVTASKFAANNATGAIAANLAKDDLVNVNSFNALRAQSEVGKTTDLTFWVIDLSGLTLTNQVYNSSRPWILNFPQS